MWVETKDSGWVNLALIGSARRLRNGEWQLVAPDGRNVGVVPERVDLDEMMITTLVPAPRGQEALSVYSWSDGPEEAQIRVERVTVVAWRVCSMAALPIIAGDAPCSNQTILIIQPDGRITEPFNREWENIEGAKKDLLAEAVAERRKKNGEIGTHPVPDKAD